MTTEEARWMPIVRPLNTATRRALSRIMPQPPVDPHANVRFDLKAFAATPHGRLQARYCVAEAACARACDAAYHDLLAQASPALRRHLGGRSRRNSQGRTLELLDTRHLGGEERLRVAQTRAAFEAARKRLARTVAVIIACLRKRHPRWWRRWERTAGDPAHLLALMCTRTFVARGRGCWQDGRYIPAPRHTGMLLLSHKMTVALNPQLASHLEGRETRRVRNQRELRKLVRTMARTSGATPDAAVHDDTDL